MQCIEEIGSNSKIKEMCPSTSLFEASNQIINFGIHVWFLNDFSRVVPGDTQKLRSFRIKDTSNLSNCHLAHELYSHVDDKKAAIQFRPQNRYSKQSASTHKSTSTLHLYQINHQNSDEKGYRTKEENVLFQFSSHFQ
uniref:Uncharacterized protein n=1 Tax=Glossina austeni TaxID=7395 RepID=A0A1A9VT09_GLOAU